MLNTTTDSELARQSAARFSGLVNSVGVKNFSRSLGVSTRQVNRMLCGSQPNPVERIIRCLQSAEQVAGDETMDFVCQEMGGHFVRTEAINESVVSAVRECAEAIATISDGHVTDMDVKEIREAISALSGLIMAVRDVRKESPDS